MTTPEELERRHTLATAVARLQDLRLREALEGSDALTAAEALELLGLGEVVIRKVGYGRQLTVRSARAGGASWSQIGCALGTSKQAAWEAHTRWIDALEALAGRDALGLDQAEAAQARRLAGDADA